MPILEAATAIRPTIAARAREIELARRLPPDLAAHMAAVGLFRMGLPREIGGPEHDPATLLRAIETIGAADASAGWCVMIGVTSSLNAAWLAPDVAREIFGPPDVISGGVFAPMGRAIEDGDSYILSGKWQWASGSANCHWLSGGAAIVVDGEVRRLKNGAPDSRMLFFPAGDATLIDSWHVAGLCGTGSGEMVVKDLRIPKGRSTSIVSDKPRANGALYAFPVFGLLALGIAAVMLGNARAAADELVELAGPNLHTGVRLPGHLRDHISDGLILYLDRRVELSGLDCVFPSRVRLDTDKRECLVLRELQLHLHRARVRPLVRHTNAEARCPIGTIRSRVARGRQQLVKARHNA